MLMQPFPFYVLKYFLILIVCNNAISGEFFDGAFVMDSNENVMTASDQSFCNEKNSYTSGYINGLFYVFYEAQNNPKDAPVVLWLSGGPGCSGMVAMMFEHGPCLVNQKSSTPELNPYTWTKNANVIYVDQPKGTGFSPVKNPYKKWSEGSSSEILRKFLDDFFVMNHQYKQSRFFIFGESYGGHYVPDLAYAILKHPYSQPAKNLKGIGIGNGLISPHAIFSTVLNFIETNPYFNNVLSKLQISQFNRKLPSCLAAIKACQKLGGKNTKLCRETTICDHIFGLIFHGIHEKKRNQFDIRAPCKRDPERQCYKFQPLSTFMNSYHTLQKLGINISKKWKVCDTQVYREHMRKDWYAESDYKMPYILKKGVKVLIYAGDADILCNWMAQEKWTRTLNWEQSNAFSRTLLSPWMVSKKQKGLVRSYGGLTFLKVSEAGHMVPHDQPAASLVMFDTFIFNKKWNHS